ncbi:MAG TPA: hypothetical protein VIF61_00360 [Methylocystis sp.]|jgi:hypothetical protein
MADATKNPPPAANKSQQQGDNQQQANASDPAAAAPAEEALKASKKAGKKGETIQVSGPLRGRRRAGRLFGANPETIDLSTITVDEYEAIVADPELRVMRV